MNVIKKSNPDLGNRSITFYNLCLSKCFTALYFYFDLFIYPPDSQESDGGTIHRASNYPDLLPEMPRYCFLLAM